MTKIDLLLDAHATIAESLLWEPVAGVLYWTDIKAPALYRLDPATLQSRRWDLPEDVGAFALLDESRSALLALRSGLFIMSLATGSLEQTAEAPWDPAYFRFNEGACDAAGLFWVGCMFDPVPPGQHAKQSGPLQRWSSQTGLVLQDGAALCHNGMGWSGDGGTFYLAHSMEHLVYAYAYSDGGLGDARIFAHVGSDGHGIPDGAAVDEEGAYWCAVHGGGCLHRYSPSGELLRVITLPVSQPTMCAFGGPDLRVMYVSSASDRLSAEQRTREKDAGSLFRLDPGVRGLPKPTHAR